MEAAISITMGKFFNLGTKITRGTKDMPECLVPVDLLHCVDVATGFKVILSDVETNQHWLADGASTILHLCRAWLTGRYTRIVPENTSVAESIRTPLEMGGPQASYDTLTSIKNRRLRLYPSALAFKSQESVGQKSMESQDGHPTVEQEWMLLQGKIWHFYHWLELMHDRMDPSRTPAEIELLKNGGNAIGFEFLEILRERDLKPRTLKLHENARAWLGYSRKVNAIHIFGRCFGDLMVPVTLSKRKLCEKASVCCHDGAAPYGQDYLMAPLSVLRERLDAFAHTDNCAQLAHNLHWCNVNQCFDMCESRKQERSGSLIPCKTLVNNLHCKHSIICGSPLTTCTELPGIFDKHPGAAIIIGTRLLTKSIPKKRAKPEDRHSGEDTVSQRQLRSDSGYLSNKGTATSQDSSIANTTAEVLSKEDYKIRGAAKSSRKLRRTQKNS